MWCRIGQVLIIHRDIISPLTVEFLRKPCLGIDRETNTTYHKPVSQFWPWFLTAVFVVWLNTSTCEMGDVLYLLIRWLIPLLLHFLHYFTSFLPSFASLLRSQESHVSSRPHFCSLWGDLWLVKYCEVSQGKYPNQGCFYCSLYPFWKHVAPMNYLYVYCVLVIDNSEDELMYQWSTYTFTVYMCYIAMKMS